MSGKTTREVMAELADAADDGVDEPEPVIETAAPDAAPAEEIEEPEPADAAEPVEAVEPEGEPGERKRGPDGKFVAAAKETPQQPPAVVAKPIVPVAVQPQALKPPADWRPAAREEFGKLPRVVQEESIRLHLEAKKILQDSAQSRQLAEGFQRTVQPFEHLFRASGRTAMDGVGYLLQTYAQLNTAPLPQRAAIVSGMIRDFLGTDEGAINLLASALEGKQAPAGGGPAAGLRPEQIQQMVRQEAQRMASESSQQAEMKAISDFEATSPEFLNDVTQEVRAIVAIEKQQGKPITSEMLKTAYEKALRLNPQTAAILKQRDDAAAAKKQQADAQKRKAAASGLRNEPAGPTGGQGKAKSTRDELARQFAKSGQSRV